MKVFENSIDVEMFVLFVIMVLLNSLGGYYLYEGEKLTDYSISVANKLCNENGGTRSLTIRSIRTDTVKCSDGSEFNIDLDIDVAAKFKSPITPRGELDGSPVK